MGSVAILIEGGGGGGGMCPVFPTPGFAPDRSRESVLFSRYFHSIMLHRSYVSNNHDSFLNYRLRT